MEIEIPQKDATEIIINPRGNCSTCVYSGERLYETITAGKSNWMVRCKRHAPTSIVNSWPEVLETDWCGDYSNGNKPQELEHG